MTSVFYDVIRLESVRGRSNMLIEGHFWRFLGNLNPKMLSAIVWTHKRHLLTSQRVFWTIVREIPCTGHFSRRVREKIKIKKRGLIFHVFRPIGTNFGLRVCLVDIINCAKFYRNRFRVWILWGVEVWQFPLDCDVAVNTVWTTVHTVIIIGWITAVYGSRSCLPYYKLLYKPWAKSMEEGNFFHVQA